MFHPNFSLGKPGYFDISVRSSLQSQFLSKASEYPGAAGDAGEIDKDGKREEEVNAAGGLFFPLIVETLGLWTPNSLRIIKLIVSKVASINRIQLHLAVKNLLLSISGLVPNIWDIPIQLICLLLLFLFLFFTNSL